MSYNDKYRSDVSSSRNSPRRAKLLRDESGTGLVEYAIVFIIFMTMLLGIADFGRVLYAYHFVSNAAREATRFGAVNGSTCKSDSSCANPATQTSIQNFVNNVPRGIDSTKLTTTATWPVQSSSPAICNDTQNAPGCTIQVQVSYAFNFVFPIVSNKTLTLKSTSQMVISH